MATTSHSYRERVVSIGLDANVVGIATEIEAARSVTAPAIRSVPPTVIFLNAGVLHRVGPHRLHVILARLLAGLGFCSLRIDLSGIGDSRSLPGTLTFRESSVADARASMDLLHAQTGATRFILFGLCSGADNALATARGDPRVVGLILLDPATYATFRSRARKLAGRIRRLGGVGAVVLWVLKVARSRLLNFAIALTRRFAAGRRPNAPPEPGRTPPPRADYGNELSALIERGVKILCIYSGANGDGYNHPDQLFEVFPRLRGRLDLVYFPAANHVFTELAAREKLLACVSDWCSRRFG